MHEQILQDIGVEQFTHVEKEVFEDANSQNLPEVALDPGIATHKRSLTMSNNISNERRDISSLRRLQL